MYAIDGSIFVGWCVAHGNFDNLVDLGLKSV